MMPDIEASVTVKSSVTDVGHSSGRAAHVRGARGTPGADVIGMRIAAIRTAHVSHTSHTMRTDIADVAASGPEMVVVMMVVPAVVVVVVMGQRAPPLRRRRT